MGQHAPRPVGRGLVLLVAAVVLAQSLVTWGFNYWQKDFIDALSNKQAQAFFQPAIARPDYIGTNDFELVG